MGLNPSYGSTTRVSCLIGPFVSILEGQFSCLPNRHRPKTWPETNTVTVFASHCETIRASARDVHLTRLNHPYGDSTTPYFNHSVSSRRPLVVCQCRVHQYSTSRESTKIRLDLLVSPKARTSNVNVDRPLDRCIGGAELFEQHMCPAT